MLVFPPVSSPLFLGFCSFRVFSFTNFASWAVSFSLGILSVDKFLECPKVCLIDGLAVRVSFFVSVEIWLG